MEPPPIGSMTPRVVKKVEPVYPNDALRVHISGTVQIVVITDIYGRVVRAKVFRGHPLLNKAALDADKQWVYEPYILNGIPKPVKFMVTFKFNLNKR